MYFSSEDKEQILKLLPDESQCKEIVAAARAKKTAKLRELLFNAGSHRDLDEVFELAFALEDEHAPYIELATKLAEQKRLAHMRYMEYENLDRFAPGSVADYEALKKHKADLYAEYVRLSKEAGEAAVRAGYASAIRARLSPFFGVRDRLLSDGNGTLPPELGKLLGALGIPQSFPYLWLAIPGRYRPRPADSPNRNDDLPDETPPKSSSYYKQQAKRTKSPLVSGDNAATDGKVGLPS